MSATATIRMTPAVDVTDPQYQVSPNFPPDKESTWHYPANEDGWVLAHNSIRYELQHFQEALEALVKRNDTLDQWHVDALQQAIAGHLEHVHGHHHIEDDLFGPFLKDRIRYPEKVRSISSILLNDNKPTSSNQRSCF